MVNGSFTPTGEKAQPKGIAGIAVQGFKALVDECSIEVRPLTLLAGANSSGKSSIMQPLLMLKQTLEAPYDPGPLLLSGPNVRFSSTEQLLSRQQGRPPRDSFVVKIQTTEAISVLLRFMRHPRRGVDVAEASVRSGEKTLVLRPGMKSSEISKRLQAFSPDIQMPSGSEFAVTRDRCFLDIMVASESDRGRVYWWDLMEPRWLFEEVVHNTIHVAALRGNPERAYRTTAVGPSFPGTFENYVASIVDQWQESRDKRLTKLGDALEQLGLTWKVTARPVDETQVELHVGRLPRPARGGAQDTVSIADVGFGVSQVLPVLVALLTAAPGQLVYIEQPEIHLHPRAQVALAQILADAAQRGVRVVAETHSDHLLLGIQSLVAEGKLSPDLVKLHWFERGADGATKVTSADLDERGAYGDWPEDFGTTALAEQSRYLDAVQPKRKIG